MRRKNIAALPTCVVVVAEFHIEGGEVGDGVSEAVGCGGLIGLWGVGDGKTLSSRGTTFVIMAVL